MNKLYTAQEIADKLQIKKTTVYELIKRGELYSSKVGKQLRISEQQLKQYLERSGSGNNIPDQKAASSSTPDGNLQIPGTSSGKFPFEAGLSSPLQRTDPLRTVFPGSRTSGQPDVHSPSGNPSPSILYEQLQQPVFSLFQKGSHSMCKSGSGTYLQPCPRCTAFSFMPL